MKITFLGTGSAVPSKERDNTSILFEWDKKNLLADCSGSAYYKLLQTGFCPKELETLFITHTHPDHSPGSRRLAELTGAPILGHWIRLQGISDTTFRPDVPMADGDRVCAGGFTLRALHTPGHAANHLCFLLEEERILIAGDQVMDRSTVVISPPDGDMLAYLESLQRLKTLGLEAIAPAHGRLLKEPDKLLQNIIDHRLEREAMVVEALEAGDQYIPDMVRRIYVDVPEALHRVAAGSVFAHLLKLRDEGRAVGDTREGPWALP